jgi:hypothetical protein
MIETEDRALTTRDFQAFAGYRIQLDCGHEILLGGNFSNSFFILSRGEGKLRTVCFRCVGIGIVEEE